MVGWERINTFASLLNYFLVHTHSLATLYRNIAHTWKIFSTLLGRQLTVVSGKTGISPILLHCFTSLEVICGNVNITQPFEANREEKQHLLSISVPWWILPITTSLWSKHYMLLMSEEIVSKCWVTYLSSGTTPVGDRAKVYIWYWPSSEHTFLSIRCFFREKYFLV